MSHEDKKDQFVPASPTPAPDMASAAPAMPASSGPVQASRPTSAMAIAGLVCSLIPFALFSLLGLIFSIIGLNQTKDGKQGGRGLAIAGLIISVLGILVNLIWLVFIVVSVANSPEFDKDFSPSTSYTTDRLTAGSDTVKGGVAEAVEVNNMQLTVREVVRGYVPSSEFYTPDSGKEFVAVTLELRNNASESQTFSSLNFKMRDATGLELSEAFIGGVTNQLQSGSLAPNGVTTGVVVFEVTKADQSLVLIYDSSYFNENTAEIKL